MFANLIGNAIRYTPAGGQVNVRVGETEGRPWFEVVDTGPGIPVAERERVFDRFYRGQGAADTGSGLGLAIVAAIAKRHQAEIALRDAPGGGLLARVTFRPGAR
jgi:signal transduction histidine kinase